MRVGSWFVHWMFVGEDAPLGGGNDCQSHRSLDTGLVEDGENLIGSVGLKLRVEVLLVVFLVSLVGVRDTALSAVAVLSSVQHRHMVLAFHEAILHTNKPLKGEVGVRHGFLVDVERVDVRTGEVEGKRAVGGGMVEDECDLCQAVEGGPLEEDEVEVVVKGVGAQESLSPLCQLLGERHA